MDKYQKLATETSSDHVDYVEAKRIKDERHQNRFNYYNAAIATLALILSDGV